MKRDRRLVLEVAMYLIVVARAGHPKAVRHDVGLVVSCKTYAMIHLSSSLVPAADSMVHLLEDLLGFTSIDAPK